MVYRFHDLTDTIPTQDERATVAEHRVLHLAIDARIYGSVQVVTWSQIARGDFDVELSRQARGIGSLRVPVFLTFEHEPDRPQVAVRGTPAEFVLAWRHVHDLYRRAHVGNAVWVWVVTGYAPQFVTAGRSWPGDSYVDWISWEAYNGSGCAQLATDPKKFTDFATDALPFYHWVMGNGARYGIDTRKPMMLSEAGSVVYPHEPGLTAKWYLGIPSVLDRYRQIKAIALFDEHGQTTCQYRFDDSSAVRRAVHSTDALLQYPWSPGIGRG